MESQYDLIHKYDWDILCILDACRADTFESVYKEYFDGEYTRVKSLACPTLEWAKHTFPEYYNIIYCSSNPYLNSVKPFKDYLASDHFYLVDNIFEWGWDRIEHIQTIPPWNVNKSVLNHIDKGKRIIAHYMQPHSPYIGKIKLNIAPFTLAKDQALDIHTAPDGTTDPIEFIQEAYVENLKIVLHYVKELHLILDKQLIITSDHGETFTKYGVSHAGDDPDLLIVPWLRL